VTHTLLVTGASGGFGLRLLDQLCADATVARVYVLVHRSPLPDLSQKTVPIDGDITQHDLGLSAAMAEEVSGNVTGILHAAADTRFSAALHDARRANVVGTEQVLELAARCQHVDRVSVMSTTHVAGKRTGAIRESELDHSAGFVNAYEQSKYEAEVAVRGWMRRVPVQVLRLSTVLGDGRDGRPFRPGAIHHALRLMYRSLAPMVPGRADAPVDLVPSAYALEAVAWLTLAGFEPGRTYHVCGGEDTVPLGDLLDLTMNAFRSLRPAWRKREIAPPALVDLDTFELFRQSVEQVGDVVMRDATSLIGSFAPQLAYPKIFDDSACRRSLEGSRIRRPDVRGAYVDMIRYLIDGHWDPERDRQMSPVTT
jgi:nucleoside-diphosphate-sugar epimerase